MKTYSKKDKILWFIFTILIVIFYSFIIIKKFDLNKAIFYILFIFILFLSCAYILFYEELRKLTLSKTKKNIIFKNNTNAFENLILLYISNKFERKFLNKIQNLRYLEAKLKVFGCYKIIIKGSIKDFDCTFIIKDSKIIIRNRVNNRKCIHYNKIKRNINMKDFKIISNDLLKEVQINYEMSYNEINDYIKYLISVFAANTDKINKLYKC